MGLQVCPWKYGKTWVYSITYDEGLADLHRFAIPLHEAYGIPGHVEVVAGQLGQVRRIGQSSFNGMRHMNGDELQDLLQRGWGVGNHSWSHEIITAAMLDRELRQARAVIETAINAPVHIYCSPGDNTNMADHILHACREIGYLGAMSLTDALNRPSQELFWINRTALHDSYYAPFYSEYDPYRNIRHAAAVNGWIIDYCHCPLETAIHPHKDCSQAQLRQRFETVLDEGGEAVWCAVPEEVIFYHACRRQLHIEILEESNDVQRYYLSLPGLSKAVSCRELSFEVDVPAAWCSFPKLWVNGQVSAVEVVRPRVLRFTVGLESKTEVRLGAGGI